MNYIPEQRRRAPLWVWIVVLIAALAFLWFVIGYSRLSNPVEQMPPTQHSPSGQSRTSP